MNSALKLAPPLLLLLVAAISSSAAASEGCEGLNTRLPTKDLHKIFGDWVLVQAVSDYEHGSNLLANLSSSRANFQLLVPDSKTIVYNEKNVFQDDSCTLFFIYMENSSEPSDSGHLRLQAKGGTVLRRGVVHHYINPGIADFYETCPYCLLMVYKVPEGRYLLSYRREGHHSDVEQLKAAHDDHRKRSECLGFSHHKAFSYDGAAALDCKQCEGVDTRLPPKDLHKVFGDWVLVWSVSDHEQGWDLLPNVSSSHVQLRLLPDKLTVQLTERNMYTDDSCSIYIINMTKFPTDHEHLTLRSVSAKVGINGVVRPYNDSAEVDFYETCSDCLLMIYKYIHGRFLLSYKREGHHSDIDQLEAAHDDHRKRAECLGFAQYKVFSYDGAAAVGSSTLPTCKRCRGLNPRLSTRDLHKIYGDWVLVWSVSDHEQGWNLLPNVSSSHLQLLPDNKSVVFNEWNLYTDQSCSHYIINLELPSDSSDDDEHTTLLTVSATVEMNGVVRPCNDSAQLDFYETCSDCLLMIYKYTHGRYLLSYRREGHHSDVDQLKAAHSYYRDQSECLGFDHDKAFAYDGVADFCHKKSSPAATHQQS